MTMQEHTDMEQYRRDRCNAWCQSKFADSDVRPPYIAADLNLAYAWALDRSVTTSEAAKHRPRHVKVEMARYGEKWSLAKIAAANYASDASPPLPTAPPASRALPLGLADLLAAPLAR